MPENEQSQSTDERTDADEENEQDYPTPGGLRGMV